MKLNKPTNMASRLMFGQLKEYLCTPQVMSGVDLEIQTEKAVQIV